MKHKNVLFKAVMLALMVCAMGMSKMEAQLIVTPANEIAGWNADSLVRNILMSGGVSVSNVEFNGFSDDLGCDNIGVFETGASPTNIGLERGLIIATGHVSVAIGPNDNDEDAEPTNCSGFYDESLAHLGGNEINDVAILEFDFVPWDSIVSFNYVFGSEEYPEWVGYEYNDIFGFFVTGLNPDGGNYLNTNVALIPGTLMAVSINNLNDHTNSEFYVDNTNGRTIEYDGFTTVLTVTFKVVPMTQYHIKMGICDVGDNLVDSGVFLEANSFTSPISYAMLLDEMNYQEIPNDYYFCANRSIDFDVETTWSYDNVKWYFGDGTSALGRNVQHAYTQDGSYEVMNVLFNPHRAQDSIYLTKVIQVRLEHGSETAFGCANQPFYWHGMQFTETGVYTDTLEASTGCDSIVELHLTMAEAAYSDTVAQVCESFVWYGQTYHGSGQYEHVFQTPMGCDSIVTLHLTVNHADTTHLEVTTCDDYPWYGTTYTEPGVYEHLLQNGHGCDSLLVLHLVMDGFFSFEESIEACNSYTWRSHTYTESGTFEDFISNPVGCDSTFILNLTLSYDIVFDTTVTSCNEFVWNGQLYEESGVYEYQLQSAEGCDSIVRLNLIIGQAHQGSLHGENQVVAASNFVNGTYMYYVPDSLSIAPNTLDWSCTNSAWVVSPSDNCYRCQLIVTDIGQGTLVAQTNHDCDSVYSIDINATWFDVDENEGNAIKMFPNPANTTVTVQVEDLIRIRLMDTFGQVVMDKTFGQVDAAILNVAVLSRGLYLVEITTKNGETTRRLVVGR